MADDGSKQSTAWPLPKFYFQVKWDSQVMLFQEVSGLDAQSEEIKYRHGDSPEFSAIKMPGMKKVGNVTMRKGTFKSDSKFWDWFNQIKMNTDQTPPCHYQLARRNGVADDGLDLDQRLADKDHGHGPQGGRQ